MYFIPEMSLLQYTWKNINWSARVNTQNMKLLCTSLTLSGEYYTYMYKIDRIYIFRIWISMSIKVCQDILEQHWRRLVDPVMAVHMTIIQLMLWVLIFVKLIIFLWCPVSNCTCLWIKVLQQREEMWDSNNMWKSWKGSKISSVWEKIVVCNETLLLS